MKRLPIAICATLCASPSFADLRVQFLEGAPKYSFIITNEGTCDIGNAELIIDFTGSNTGLIFDVTAAGAGEEEFQPFEVTEGASFLTSEPTISDGDKTATLLIKNLHAAQGISFTIEVDVTNSARESAVSDDGINGTMASLSARDKQVAAILGANAEVVFTTGACTS